MPQKKDPPDRARGVLGSTTRCCLHSELYPRCGLKIMMRSSFILHVSSLVWHTRNTDGHLNTFSVLTMAFFIGTDTAKRLILLIRADVPCYIVTARLQPLLQKFRFWCHMICIVLHGCEEICRKICFSFLAYLRDGENFRKRIRKFGKRRAS